MGKNMTVGKRIILGFTLVIVIAVTIGGLGVWNMSIAKVNSQKLGQRICSRSSGGHRVTRGSQSRDVSDARVWHE